MSKDGANEGAIEKSKACPKKVLHIISPGTSSRYAQYGSKEE